MRKFLTLALMLSLCLIPLSLLSQEKDLKVPMAIGFYGGLNFNMHSPAFTITDVVKFDINKTGVGGAIGGIFNYPLNNTFVFSGRLGYNPIGTTLSKLFSNKNFDLDASLPYIELAPVMQFHNLFPVKPLYLLAGLEFGIPVSTSAVLDSVGIKRDIETNPNLRGALVLGAGYVLKASKSVWITPELSYRIPFANVSSNAQLSKWSVSQLRLGLNITFSLAKDEEEPPLPDVSDLKVGFKEIRSFDADGKPKPVESVKLEDVQYTELFPFVPYVFCDENQPEPTKDEQVMIGKTESGEFNIQKLEPDAVKINHSTLDIIGIRMKQNPSAEITITGTNDSKTEKNDKELALKRAEFAKQYLVDNYGINPELINVRGSGLPTKPSAQTVEDGVAENRRIEFTSSNPALFKPILIQGDNQRIADPGLIEFIPSIQTKDSIVNWQMEISQADKVLRLNQGTGMPNALQWGIHPNELTNKQIPIDYKLTARTAKGYEGTYTGSIPIEYFSSTRKKSEDLPDKTVSKFSLILFDFDKYDVSKSDQEIIDNYILPAIKFNSTVKVYGYSDRIGEEVYNQTLSTKRAQTVADIITSKMKDVKINVYGVGENVPIFNNDSPVGRQLSRTVQVHVITPK
jgi:outer membrane protein OmpA-like peptidoglycan-associated protein